MSNGNGTAIPYGTQIGSRKQDFPAGVITKDSALKVPTRPMPDVEGCEKVQHTNASFNKNTGAGRKA